MFCSLFQRLEMLYRPNFNRRLHRINRQADVVLTNFSTNVSTSITSQSDDPPPKYTPPPSYSTATGARLARMLRQSIRRSIHRLQNGLGASQEEISYCKNTEPSPPDYSMIIIENSRDNINDTNVSLNIDNSDRILYERLGPNTDAISSSERLGLEDLGAYSLDVETFYENLPSQQKECVLALGFQALQHADSESILVESADHINTDSVNDTVINLGL